MCGIIGINAKSKNIVFEVVQGLKNLEYRGYDSAGIATILDDKIEAIKVEGKIASLEDALNNNPEFKSNLAIGHTRWATHGAANKINAHPHHTKQVAVVHNGIIENYQELKRELIGGGYEFHSQTDSEVIPNLITFYLNQGEEPLKAVQKSIERLHGAYSIAVIFMHYPDLMIAARKGSPLVVGYGDDQNIIASDPYALAFLTGKISYLEEGDVAVLYSDEVTVFNKDGIEVKRNIVAINNMVNNLGKGNFSHYMLKEIFEQPSVAADLINHLYNMSDNSLQFENIDLNWKEISKITLVACGSSYYAAMVSKYWLEQYINLPIEVDIASEFRYRASYLPKNGLCIFLSQSGETADTLAALKYAKNSGQKTLSIVNVLKSSIDRESDYTIPCLAGMEISVASTKGFTTQLIVLLALSLYISKKREEISQDEFEKKLSYVTEIPGRIADVLNNADSIKTVAASISKAKNVIFVGRNYIYPIALEGALKLKELSYIHAQAFAAGELKHGPIALVDENVPIVVLAPQNDLFEKTYSNAQEISARGGKLITISSSFGNQVLKDISWSGIDVGVSDKLIEPIIYTIPMQLLAYYVAVKNGTDVDQPRNLAKSVTVE